MKTFFKLLTLTLFLGPWFADDTYGQLMEYKLYAIQDSVTPFATSIEKTNVVLDLKSHKFWQLNEKAVTKSRLSTLKKSETNWQSFVANSDSSNYALKSDTANYAKKSDTCVYATSTAGTAVSDTVTLSLKTQDPDVIRKTNGNNIMGQNLIIHGDSLVIDDAYNHVRTKLVSPPANSGLVITNDTSAVMFEMAYGQMVIKNPQLGTIANTTISTTQYQAQFTTDRDSIYFGKKIRLSNGSAINEFSIDNTLSGNSNIAVPTERAIKYYTDNHVWTLSSITSLQDSLTKKLNKTDSLYFYTSKWKGTKYAKDLSTRATNDSILLVRLRNEYKTDSAVKNISIATKLVAADTNSISYRIEQSLITDTIRLDSSKIKHLFSTPRIILPAPVSGYLNVIVNVFGAYVRANADYTGDSTMIIYYASQNPFAQAINIIDGTLPKMNKFIEQSDAPISQGAIYIKSKTSNPVGATAAGYLTLYITYRRVKIL